MAPSPHLEVVQPSVWALAPPYASVVALKLPLFQQMMAAASDLWNVKKQLVSCLYIISINICTLGIETGQFSMDVAKHAKLACTQATNSSPYGALGIFSNEGYPPQSGLHPSGSTDLPEPIT